jgi:hypothetical protein
MLFKETVTPSTLALIHQLFQIKELNDFELVGGTSLSLQIGHRTSIDIDFFCQNPFETRQIKECLLENFQKHSISFDYETKNTLVGSIGQVKIDFIRHAYPKINEPIVMEGIRLCSLEDIAAMKVSVITDNGTRLKDFVDLYYLLHRFSLKDIIQFYEKKYQSENSFHALKSITYFDNLEERDANLINFLPDKYISFERLKSYLVNEVENYLKKL